MSTIALDVYVTGSALGSKLADEPEEFWYFLQEMIADAPGDFCTDVADHAGGQSAIDIAKFLRELADAIENAM